MSLFDKYVQLSTLNKQDQLVRQNRALLEETAEQNQNLRILQQQMNQVNHQQEQLLAYQQQQHAAATQQKFLKDAVFTINELLNSIDKIKEPIVQFGVLVGSYGTLKNLLKQSTDQLDEIQDKVASSRLTERLDELREKLNAHEAAFQSSEIGKFLEARDNYERESTPLLQSLGDLRADRAKPTLGAISPKLAAYVQKKAGTSIENLIANNDLETLGRLSQEAETAQKKIGLYLTVFGIAAAIPWLDLIIGLMSDPKRAKIAAALFNIGGIAGGLAGGTFLIGLGIGCLVMFIINLVRRSQISPVTSSLTPYVRSTKKWEQDKVKSEPIKVKLAEISKKYDYEKAADRMLKKYPKILEQLGHPTAVINALFSKWGVD